MGKEIIAFGNTEVEKQISPTENALFQYLARFLGILLGIKMNLKRLCPCV